MNLKRTIATISLVLATSVVLNGAHAKDIFGMFNVQKVDDQSVVKMAGDLHPHVDKQMKVAQDTPQLDGRSLRLRDYKRIQLSGIRNWLDSWRNQLSLFLS